MRVILINGPIASGKSTIGRHLAMEMKERGIRAVFYDLDEEMMDVNASFKWHNKNEKLHDWIKVRHRVALKTTANLERRMNTIISGPFFIEDEIGGVVRYISHPCEVYIFNLVVPLEERMKRDSLRNHHAIPSEEIVDQQLVIETLEEHYGHDIDNTHSIEHTIHEIFKCVEYGLGMLSVPELTLHQVQSHAHE
jgi:cytidylate kinase